MALIAWLLSKIETGLEQAESGKILSNSEVKERMVKWLE